MKFNGDGYLDPGIHDYKADEIEAHLVDGFPTSITRTAIWLGYGRHCNDVRACGICVIEFIDGSFSTLKNDPSDIDLVGFADMEEVNNLPAAMKDAFRKLFLGPDTKSTHLCDAYFVPTVPPGHPHEGKLRSTRKYWMGEFGFDRQDRPKGIIRTIVS